MSTKNAIGCTFKSDDKVFGRPAAVWAAVQPADAMRQGWSHRKTLPPISAQILGTAASSVRV